ncbi:MAG: DNA internalization-related competence protein ComEC/Rec2 [Pseudomonadota bacterium]
MLKVAVAFLIGVLSLTVFAMLPHWYWCLVMLPAVIILHKFPQCNLFMFALLGFLWALAHAHHSLYPSLEKTIEGEDLDVIGEIASIPTKYGRSTRFEFLIQSRVHSDEESLLPRKVRLNWYGNAPELQIGEIWQLRIRLKRPWGFANPGGFDFEKWLFEQGIRATGYVRTKGNNILVEKTNLFSPAIYLRAKLNQKIEESNNSYTGIIKALVLGERGQMDSKSWQVLTQTGTNHLLAISGLHVGIVSGFVYFILVWCWKRSERLCLRIPAQQIAAIGAILAAIFYAMLAGFSIPTQRAMTMATVVFFSIFMMQSFRPWNILSLALICVLLVDPFSILAPGFWLSFIAVAIILLSLKHHSMTNNKRWVGVVKIQFILALGLLPVTLLFFQQASLISPLANLFAVPWVSVLIVPMALVGSVFLLIYEPMGALLLQGADSLIGLFWSALNYLHSMPFSSWQHAIPVWTIVPAVFGVLLLLTPRGWPAKILSVALLSPLMFAEPVQVSEEDLSLFVLDVGQGTAVVLQSGENVLVYDTGPKFSSGFNAGEAVVATFLRERGIKEIDVLMVSHGDKDHAGGLEGLLNHYNAKQLIVNQINDYSHENLLACRAGMQWSWPSVEFEVLNPERTLPANSIGKLSKNNSSCVLRVQHASGDLLLSGDIERKIEKLLIKEHFDSLNVDILIAPHHGSKSSSSKAFIEATSPKFVVFTTGYRNPYGFPDEKVVSRYKEFGSHLVNSATQGMISFEFSNKNGLQLLPGYREVRQRFWHTQP